MVLYGWSYKAGTTVHYSCYYYDDNFTTVCINEILPAIHTRGTLGKANTAWTREIDPKPDVVYILPVEINKRER